MRRLKPIYLPLSVGVEGIDLLYEFLVHSNCIGYIYPMTCEIEYENGRSYNVSSYNVSSHFLECNTSSGYVRLPIP